MMGGASSGKKQREVYVGNLTIGAVTDVMLRELLNGALSHLMPNPELNPPVVNVGMDPSGACVIALGHTSLFWHGPVRCVCHLSRSYFSFWPGCQQAGLSGLPRGQQLVGSPLDLDHESSCRQAAAGLPELA